TAEDLARLGADVMRAHAGRPSRLGLTADSVAQMLRPQLPGQAPADDFIGLGWMCGGRDAGLRFGHAGWNEGYIAELRCLPARGQGAVVMLNANQGDPLRAEVLGALGRAYGWPDARGAAVAAGARDYAGSYRGAHGLALVITGDAG